MFQIVCDINDSQWIPSWFFEVVDPAIPPDWICNAFHGEPALVLGPDFVARDLAAYASMVELESDQVDRFWRRVKDLDGSA